MFRQTVGAWADDDDDDDFPNGQPDPDDMDDDDFPNGQPDPDEMDDDLSDVDDDQTTYSMVKMAIAHFTQSSETPSDIEPTQDAYGSPSSSDIEPTQDAYGSPLSSDIEATPNAYDSPDIVIEATPNAYDSPDIVIEATPNAYDSPDIVIEATPNAYDSPDIVIEATPNAYDSPDIVIEATPNAYDSPRYDSGDNEDYVRPAWSPAFPIQRQEAVSVPVRFVHQGIATERFGEPPANVCDSETPNILLDVVHCAQFFAQGDVRSEYIEEPLVRTVIELILSEACAAPISQDILHRLRHDVARISDQCEHAVILDESDPMKWLDLVTFSRIPVDHDKYGPLQQWVRANVHEGMPLLDVYVKRLVTQLAN